MVLVALADNERGGGHEALHHTLTVGRRPAPWNPRSGSWDRRRPRRRHEGLEEAGVGPSLRVGLDPHAEAGARRLHRLEGRVARPGARDETGMPADALVVVAADLHRRPDHAGHERCRGRCARRARGSRRRRHRACCRRCGPGCAAPRCRPRRRPSPACRDRPRASAGPTRSRPGRDGSRTRPARRRPARSRGGPASPNHAPATSPPPTSTRASSMPTTCSAIGVVGVRTAGQQHRETPGGLDALHVGGRDDPARHRAPRAPVDVLGIGGDPHDGATGRRHAPSLARRSACSREACDERLEEARVAADLGVPLHGDGEAGPRVLDRLERAVEAPRPTRGSRGGSGRTGGGSSARRRRSRGSPRPASRPRS